MSTSRQERSPRRSIISGLSGNLNAVRAECSYRAGIDRVFDQRMPARNLRPKARLHSAGPSGARFNMSEQRRPSILSNVRAALPPKWCERIASGAVGAESVLQVPRKRCRAARSTARTGPARGCLRPWTTVCVRPARNPALSAGGGSPDYPQRTRSRGHNRWPSASH